MKPPWLSVLMPTFNGESYLPAAFDSLLLQNDPAIECIVVDDGSTDRTLEIAQSYKSKLEVRIIQIEYCGNWVKKTNRALAEAKGDFISILPQDDLWQPGRLEALKKIILLNPTVDIILHPALYIDKEGRRLGAWNPPLKPSRVLSGKDEVFEHLLVQNFMALVTPIFRRSLALELKGFDDTFWYAADWDFWLKAMLRSKAWYHPVALSAFRLHRESLTSLRSSAVEGLRRELDTVLKRYESELSGKKSLNQRIHAAAVFSNEVNVFLFSQIHHKPAPLSGLIKAFLALGFCGLNRYLRDSRIFERLFSRLKIPQ